MIKANKIYNELSIYTENKIILWGGGFFGRQYLEKLRWFEIDVVAFCDNNSEIHGTEIDGVPVISPDELRETLGENNDIVVQIACETDEGVLIKQLQNLGVKKYVSKVGILRQLLYLKRDSDIDFDDKFKVNDNNIRISKIDSELSIYKDNKVIVLGKSKNNNLLQMMKYNKIDIYAHCINYIEFVSKKIDDIKVINIDELKKLIKSDEHCVIQISDNSITDEYLSSIGVKKYVSLNEAVEVFKYIKRCEYTINNPELLNISTMVDRTYDSLQVLKEHMVLNFNDNIVIVCMIGKTGDVTLWNTFHKYSIPFVNTWHSIDAIDRNLLLSESNKKIKIITAVREPIIQNLSHMFETLSLAGSRGGIFRSLHNMTFPFESSVLLKNGGDAQYIFDITMENMIKSQNTSVEYFTNEFCKKIVDIKKVPFDKQKGYTIIKEGNIEVFVYQLEKMNDIVNEMAKFVGGDFKEWEMGNVASDKWIADSYKHAQKEIKISQEYFDKCFSESYVSHFYSEEDIEKFKSRWRLHIRENS